MSSSIYDPTFSSSDTLDAHHQLFKDRSSRIPCLTIIFHPQLTRIGELALLPGLMASEPVSISRHNPRFSRPESDERQPLCDPFVSRKPITLERLDEKYLTITAAAGVHLEVDDRKIDSSLTIPFAALSDGVLLAISRRIILLLHMVNLCERSPLPGMIGESEGIHEVRRRIARVADLDVPVLILGETGVGKELVASCIHAASRRSSAAFRAVNMATVQDGTGASILFGHVRGAFTGATSRQSGLFLEANEGTLFLDEVGDTPPLIQPMLLRTLSERSILPVGASKEIRVDVRIVAATELDIEQNSGDGEFRASLRHRLGGYEIHVPPLRERREDIPRLVLHFLDRVLTDIGERDRLAPLETERFMWFPPALMLLLYRHDWPGNVRQLSNVVHQLVISNRGMGTLQLDEQTRRVLEERPRFVSPGPVSASLGRSPHAATLPSASSMPPGTPSPRRSSKDIPDDEIFQALARHDWRVGPAATFLGMPRSTFYDRMERHPDIRKAVDVPRAEIEDALTRLHGDLTRVAQSLRVSPRGLRLRIRSLEIDPRKYG